MDRTTAEPVGRGTRMAGRGKDVVVTAGEGALQGSGGLWRPPAHLVLADGTVFAGRAFGALDQEDGSVASGEVVFNTVLAGYQEVLTDPSYAGQIVTFTATHLGNYGTCATDDESARPQCRGVVTRSAARRPSSWRAEEDLDAYLRRHGVPGITDVDTRRLTRHLRSQGAIPGAFGTAPVEVLAAKAAAEPGTAGVDLVSTVTTTEPYVVPGGQARVVVVDVGVKRSILRHLARFATLEVVPAWTPASEILARRPDAVVVSNGPGDPALLQPQVQMVAEVLGSVPLLGICLGHQLLGQAVGMSTVKLPFGHHGGNHPVRRVGEDRVQITSQNHNFALVDDAPPGVEITHVNLNDGVVEGIAVPAARAVGVQYHPEAGPGPHDGSRVFDELAERLGVAR
jgi:carbamoyl-phosphate synthase small subunit